MGRTSKRTEEIQKRAVSVAEYIIETKCTVRQAAKHFYVSKSTIHKDITQVLKKMHKDKLLRDATAVLEINKAERYMRGGMATKKKWESMISDGVMTPLAEEFLKGRTKSSLWKELNN